MEEQEIQALEENAQVDQAEVKEDEQFFQQDPAYDGTIGYSEPKPIGGVYALFQEVLGTKDTTKVSNLDKVEIGDIGITVRDALKINLIARTFKHPRFGEFFMSQAGIISDSAMSKKGWFTELFVTSKKFAQRDTSSSLNLPQQQKKWTLFGKNQSNP